MSTCKFCNRDFENRQSVKAHLKYCAAYKALRQESALGKQPRNADPGPRNGNEARAYRAGRGISHDLADEVQALRLQLDLDQLRELSEDRRQTREQRQQREIQIEAAARAEQQKQRERERQKAEERERRRAIIQQLKASVGGPNVKDILPWPMISEIHSRIEQECAKLDLLDIPMEELGYRAQAILHSVMAEDRDQWPLIQQKCRFKVLREFLRFFEKHWWPQIVRNWDRLTPEQQELARQYYEEYKFWKSKLWL